MEKNLLNALFSKLIVLLLTAIGVFGLQSETYAQYCTMTYQYTSCGSYGPNQVTIGTFTHSPTCGTANYQNYTTTIIPINANVSTPVSITTLGWTGIGIAADFNNDFDFTDPGEQLGLPIYIELSTAVYTFNITVPPHVPTGNYRLRIWSRLANSSGPNNGVDPCGSGYGYGRYLDYTLAVTNPATCLAPSNVQVVPTSNTAAISWTASSSTPANYRWKVVASGADPVTAPAVSTGVTATTSANATVLSPATNYDAYVKSLCSASDSSVWTLVSPFSTLCGGTPATGVAASSVALACPNVNFNLELTGVNADPGITYQWQSSPTATGTFTNIASATTPTFAVSQTAPTFYRCIVTCSGSSLTSTSNVINVGINTPNNCYCIPTSTTGTNYHITSFSTTGGLTNITNNSTGSGSYNQYLAQSASALMTSTVNFSLTTASQFVYRGIYIDWNQDGVFDETTEKVYTGNYSSVTGTTVTGSFNVPATATPGSTRMRVRSSYYLGATMNACSNLSNGEAEDYTFTVVTPVGVCINPLNLTTSGINPTAATVNFTAPTVGNTPTNYIYELRTDGSAVGSGPVGLTANATVTASPVSFTTLAPATNYVFYIRTFCSVGDSSSWVSIPFSTTFDTLTPVSLSNFNFDVIANGIGLPLTSTTNDVDGASYALIAKDYQATASGALPTYGVPNNRIIQNGIRKYRLENYSLNNSLRQTLAQTNGTVRFIAPKRANKVYIMGVSGSNVSNFNAIIHFADGTTQTQAMNFADWYTSNNQVVVSGLGRINRNTNVVEGTATGGPRFHDTSIVITTANREKQIDSIVIQRTGTLNGVSNVMAVSIVPNVNQSCRLPGYLTIANENCVGGLLSWQGNGTNTNYEISYGAIGTQANAGTIVAVTGVAGANTYQWTNATTNTSLQLYVRASCGGGSYSDWVGPLEVTLPSTIVTPTFTLPSDLCSGATAPTLPTVSNNSVDGTWSPAVISNTTSGTYTFTPAASFPCAIPVTVSINVSSIITPTFNAIPDFCNGTTAPILPTTSNNGFAGTWSPATISNIASGTYTFTPTSGSSCVGPATMSVTVNPIAQETETVEICSGELPYLWNNISVSNGGVIAATYTTVGSNGCDSITTLNLNVVVNTNPSISVSANPSTNVSMGQSVTFTATLQDAVGSNPTIQWIKSGNVIAGASGTTWTGVAGVNFYNGDEIFAIAEGFNDCAANSNIESNHLDMQVGLSIGNNPLPNGFKLYPNPAKNNITIEGLKKGDTYKIVDALGRTLITQTVSVTKTQVEDIATLNVGVYFIIFQNSDGKLWMQKINKL